MTTSTLTETYGQSPISFQPDGWVNATQMAKPFGKLPAGFLRTDTAKAFIAALESETVMRNHITVSDLNAEATVAGNPVTVRQGGSAQGTWMHPDLALEFARWLSPEFAIWCNRTIRKILSGQTGESADVAQLASAVAELTRAVAGIVAVMPSSRLPASSAPAFSFSATGGRPPTYRLNQILPAIKQAAPDYANRRPYTVLYRAALGVSDLSENTFRRLVIKAIALGLIVRNEADGLLYTT